jgi:hypothetical protein
VSGGENQGAWQATADLGRCRSAATQSRRFDVIWAQEEAGALGTADEDGEGSDHSYDVAHTRTNKIQNAADAVRHESTSS